MYILIAVLCTYLCSITTNTVWPEILAGIYFVRLMKFLHLVEFTLAAGQPYVIMIFIAKWLIQNEQELDCNDNESASSYKPGD